MTCHAGAGSRKAGHVLVTAGSRAGVSAQVYHTARMQRVFATRFSGDGAYVFSGSDDMNVRVWKVRARRVSPALRSHSSGVPALSARCCGAASPLAWCVSWQR